MGLGCFGKGLITGFAILSRAHLWRARALAAAAFHSVLRKCGYAQLHMWANVQVSLLALGDTEVEISALELVRAPQPAPSRQVYIWALGQQHHFALAP